MSESSLKEAARRLVASSCAEQGLEEQITDPVVIGKVAAMLKAGSDAPLRRGAIGVEEVSALDGRSDHDVLKDREEDRSLAA